jgi:hypothetical protein
MPRGKDFADLVHRILVNDRQFNLAITASGMGMAYDTLYSRLNSRTCFSAEEIRKLIKTVPDPRIISYFLDETTFVAVERPILPENAQMESLLPTAYRLVHGASDILELIAGALRDGRVDHRETAKIEKELDAVERVILALREKVRRPNA